MREDDGRPRTAPAHEVGQALDALSLADLDARIAVLRAEIARIEAAIAAKRAAQGAADSVFRRG